MPLGPLTGLATKTTLTFLHMGSLQEWCDTLEFQLLEIGQLSLSEAPSRALAGWCGQHRAPGCSEWECHRRAL